MQAGADTSSAVERALLLFGSAQVVLVGLVGWLGRVWLARIDRREQHDADRRLEALRHEFGVQREHLALALKAEAEKSSRYGALAGQYIGASQAAAQSRRLDAIGALWEATLRNRETSGIVGIFDETWPADQLRAGKANSAIRRVLGVGRLQDLTKHVKTDDIERVRPFLSRHLWRLFFLHRMIHGRALFSIGGMPFDSKEQLWYDQADVRQSLQAALSEKQWEQFDRLPRGKLRAASRYLEEAMLAEVERWVSGSAPTEAQLKEVRRLADLLEAPGTVDALLRPPQVDA